MNRVFFLIIQAVRIGSYLWSFSVYCETEDETKKDRLPKEERVQIPGIETRQSGGLRSNESGQLETHPTRSRYSNRSAYDNGIAPIQEPTQPISGGGRRVVPIQTFDEANG